MHAFKTCPHIFFLHSSVDGHLAIANSAAVNICAQVFEGLFPNLSALLRSGIAGINGNSVFNFIFRMFFCMWLQCPGGPRWPVTRGWVSGAEPCAVGDGELLPPCALASRAEERHSYCFIVLLLFLLGPRIPNLSLSLQQMCLWRSWLPCLPYAASTSASTL